MIQRVTTQEGKLNLIYLSTKEQNLKIFQFPGKANDLILKGEFVFLEGSYESSLQFEWMNKKLSYTLNFPYPTQKTVSIPDPEEFKYPRLIKIKGAYIITGIFIQGEHKWLAKAVFPGKIPNGYYFFDQQ